MKATNSLFLGFLLFSISMVFGQSNPEQGKFKSQATGYDQQAQGDYFKHLGDSLKFEQPDSAEFYYLKALNVSIEQNNQFEEATLLSKIGGVQYIQGDYYKALDQFTKSLALFRELYDDRGIAAGLNNVAMILNIQEKFDEAILNHKKSISICININDTLLEERNWFNLAITFNAMKEYDSAMFCVNKAILLCKLMGDTTEYMLNKNLLGNIYLNKKEYYNSLKEFSVVIESSTFDNKWELCYALAGMAQSSLMLGNSNQALKYAIKSDSLAHELNTLWDLQNISLILSDIYFRQNNYLLAYRYYVDYKSYTDSLFSKEQASEMNHLHLLQKEAENRALQLTFDKQKQELKNKNLWISIYTSGALLFLLVVLLQWRNNRNKTNLNKKLQAKNSIIAHKNKELELANATKDRFFNMIAHDLKSPLSIMISFTEILHDNLELYDEKQIKEFLESLHQSSLQGFKLLENLLDWARLQTNSFLFQPNQLKILPLVEETIRLLENNALEKQITITNEVDQDIMANIDRNMFLVVLRNLISNAIKFSHPGGTVLIKVVRLEHEVGISVIDHGLGISESDLPKLFKLDSFITRPGTNQEKGTGIGLVLCHDFIKKMGGSITIKSTEGKGSVFTFTLPV